VKRKFIPERHGRCHPHRHAAIRVRFCTLLVPRRFFMA
jgi:hypothetical protein